MALIYEPKRGSLIAVGGRHGGIFDETWELRGTTWEQLFPNDTAGAVDDAAIAYDSVEGAVVLGSASVPRLRWRNASFADEVCVAGNDADLDGRAGCSDPDCFGRCTPTCIPNELPAGAVWPTDCPAGQPRCGDGICQAIESVASCPGDCL